MILDNWTSKKASLIEKDMEDIKNLGLASKPTTNEGKTILILETLCYEIKKKIDFHYISFFACVVWVWGVGFSITRLNFKSSVCHDPTSWKCIFGHPHDRLLLWWNGMFHIHIFGFI
jgi:hypothetical protein